MNHPYNRTQENWYLPLLKQGTKVEFDNNIIKGTGFIDGIAAESVAVIGRNYIIRVESINSKLELHYSHIAVFELFIKVI